MSKYQNYLCTRESVERQLEKANTSSTYSADFEAYVDDAIVGISRYITDAHCHRSFVPFVHTETIYADTPKWDWYYQRGAYVYPLKNTAYQDLLEIDSITLNGTAIDSANYRLNAYGEPPYNEIRFNQAAVSIPTSSSFTTSLVIVGTWGYHKRPDSMYQQVETGVSIATTTGTSLTVAASSAYETWQYIKLEDEIMLIEALANATTLTVKRGVNGTTAAAHSSVAVSKLLIQEDISLAATRLVSWAYNNRNDLGTQLSLPDGSVIRNQMPAFVRDALNRYVLINFGTV